MPRLKSSVFMDYVEWVCPCGAMTITDGPSAFFDAWLREHKDHHDGTVLESHAPECGRILTTVPSPRTITAPEPKTEQITHQLLSRPGDNGETEPRPPNPPTEESLMSLTTPRVQGRDLQSRLDAAWERIRRAALPSDWASASHEADAAAVCALEGLAAAYEAGRTGATAPVTFETWMSLVDDELVRRVHLTHEDLPDVDYRGMYESLQSPEEAALYAIEFAAE